MENNENSKNLINATASGRHKSGQHCGRPVADRKHRSDDVLNVIDGMKARIKQLLDETNQLKCENTRLRKQLFNNSNDKRL